MALGVINCVWAGLVWLAPHLSVAGAILWMPIVATIPSSTVGLLISILLARGPYRLAAAAMNLTALSYMAVAAWLMLR
jgi:hypothetical protein